MRQSRRDDLPVWLLLGLILALAAGIRFYELGTQSLWSDEGNSAALAARSLAQIGRDAGNDIHPPLYYWLLHFWTGSFGNHEFALRSLSAVLGVLLVWVIADLGRRLFSPATGLAAGFIAALAPFQVYYSQEARMYILLALEAAVAMLLFWLYVTAELRTTKPWHRVILGALLVLVWIAGLYTHYFYPVIIGLQALLYFAWLWMTRPAGNISERLLVWLGLIGLAGLAFLPWALAVFRQFSAWSAPSDRPAILTGIASVFSQLVVGPEVLMKGAIWGPWAVGFLAVVGALPWPVRDTHGSRASHVLRLLIAPAWAIIPALALLALGLYREAYLKFLLVSSPAISLLLARAVLGPASWLQTREVRDGAAPTGVSRTAPLLASVWVVGALALIGGLSGAALARYFSDPAAARDDYRGISRFIMATGHPGDAIVLDAPGQQEVFDYYYEGDLPVYPLPRQRPLDPEATRRELEDLLTHEKLFAVYWGAQEADPGGIIESWLDSHGYKTMEEWRGDVRMAVYVMPERQPPEEQQTDLDLHFGDDMALTEYRGWNLAPTAGEVIQMQFNWRALKALEHRYKVFVQLLDTRDQIVAQLDAEPGGGSRPTDEWQAGDEVVDNHGLLIPPGTPPGAYRRISGLYDAETLERLRLPDGSDHLSLPPITVARSEKPPPLEALQMQHPERFDFGGISLLGHDRHKRGFRHAPDAPLKPGDLLHLSLYWQANVPPRADWWMDLTLTDPDGVTVARLQAPLAGETYPTRLWEEDEIVRGEHDLRLPSALPPGAYRLSLALLPDFDTPAGTAYLGEIEVE
jgi:4-amino-4-deoxy-L-arabinose transferase-like glycosyltransferase